MAGPPAGPQVPAAVVVEVTGQPLQPGYQTPGDVALTVDLVEDVRLADRHIAVRASVLVVDQAGCKRNSVGCAAFSLVLSPLCS